MISRRFVLQSREPTRRIRSWADNQDKVLVRWPDGRECVLDVLVVHAIVVLLTHGAQRVRDPTKFDHLLEAWFPLDKRQTPAVS